MEKLKILLGWLIIALTLCFVVVSFIAVLFPTLIPEWLFLLDLVIGGSLWIGYLFNQWQNRRNSKK